MHQTIEGLTSQLMQLPKRERLEIARFLLFLDNRSNATDVESTWEQEILDRVQAVDAGTATGIDYNEALKILEKRYSQ